MNYLTIRNKYSILNTVENLIILTLKDFVQRFQFIMDLNQVIVYLIYVVEDPMQAVYHQLLIFWDT